MSAVNYKAYSGVQESADLMAALLFFVNYNGLDGPEWEARLYAKRNRFKAWHEDAAEVSG